MQPTPRRILVNKYLEGQTLSLRVLMVLSMAEAAQQPLDWERLARGEESEQPAEPEESQKPEPEGDDASEAEQHKRAEFNEWQLQEATRIVHAVELAVAAREAAEQGDLVAAASAARQALQLDKSSVQAKAVLSFIRDAKRRARPAAHSKKPRNRQGGAFGRGPPPNPRKRHDGPAFALLAEESNSRTVVGRRSSSSASSLSLADDDRKPRTLYALSSPSLPDLGSEPSIRVLRESSLTSWVTVGLHPEEPPEPSYADSVASAAEPEPEPEPEPEGPPEVGTQTAVDSAALAAWTYVYREAAHLWAFAEGDAIEVLNRRRIRKRGEPDRVEEQWHPARVTRYTAPKLDGAGDSAGWLSEWQVHFRYDDGSEPLRWSKGQPLHGAESALLLAPPSAGVDEETGLPPAQGVAMVRRRGGASGPVQAESKEETPEEEAPEPPDEEAEMDGPAVAPEETAQPLAELSMEGLVSSISAAPGADACKALVELTAEGEDKATVVAAVEAGAVVAVLAALRAEPSDASLQRQGFRTLGCLAAGGGEGGEDHDNQGCEVFVAEGGVELLLVGMAAHIEEAEVQREACGLISALAYHGGGTSAADGVCGVLLEGGAVAAVATTLRTHSAAGGDCLAAKEACSALSNLVAHGPSAIAAAAREAGVAGLARAALATHAGDEAFEQLEYQKQRLDSELG
eukprot:COSAG04_NODE_307_length_17238_cov_17.860260_13_plen_686_part_00